MDHVNSFDIAVLSLFGIAMLLGSIGNLCILLSVFNNRNLRRVTHMLIMNQAASDFLLSALSIPLRMLRICVKKSIFESKVLSSDEFCHISSGLNAAVLGASSYGLLLLTVDKFIAVKQPLAYRARMTKTYMIIPVVASWLVPLALGLCGAFIDVLQADLHDHSHDVACIKSSTFNHIYALCVYFALLILPLIAMLPLYSYILIKVKNSWRSSSSHVADGIVQRQPANFRRIIHEETHRKREMKLTKGIVLILGVHICCLTPIVILDFIHIILGHPIPYIVDEICLLILHLNAVLDPLIYTRHSRDIKRAIARLICPPKRHVIGIQDNSKWRRRVNRTALKTAQQMANLSKNNISPDDARIQDPSYISHGNDSQTSSFGNVYDNYMLSITSSL